MCSISSCMNKLETQASSIIALLISRFSPMSPDVLSVQHLCHSCIKVKVLFDCEQDLLWFLSFYPVGIDIITRGKIKDFHHYLNISSFSQNSVSFCLGKRSKPYHSCMCALERRVVNMLSLLFGPILACDMQVQSG